MCWTETSNWVQISVMFTFRLMSLCDAKGPSYVYLLVGEKIIKIGIIEIYFWKEESINHKTEKKKYRDFFDNFNFYD